MKWFKEVFLPSFENCNGKRVSGKQGQIFEKYLDRIQKNKTHRGGVQYEQDRISCSYG